MGTKLYKQGPAEGDTATKVYIGDKAFTSKVQLKEIQQLKSTLEDKASTSKVQLKKTQQLKSTLGTKLSLARSS